MIEATGGARWSAARWMVAASMALGFACGDDGEDMGMGMDASVGGPDAIVPGPDAADGRDATVVDAGDEMDAGNGRDAGAGDAGEEDLEEQVRMILADNCSPCHTSGASGGMNIGLEAVDFVAATVGVQSQEVPAQNRIEPGDRTESYLFEKISSDNPQVGARMPRGRPPLSGEDIETIGAYIDSL